MSNHCGRKNCFNRFKIPRRGRFWVVFGRVIWAKCLVRKFQRYLRLKYLTFFQIAFSREQLYVFEGNLGAEWVFVELEWP